jgi:hypothetical protein
MNQSIVRNAREPKFRSNLMARILVPTMVLTLFAVVATPAMDTLIQDEKALTVLKLLQRVTEASEKHYEDCGQLALEFSSPTPSHAYGQKRYHHLSMEQFYEGWNGPYLMVPISSADNPFGGSVQLRNNLSSHPALGFELDDGPAHEEGQYLSISKVPLDIAARIDAYYDGKNDDGSPASANWQTEGKVEYSAEDDGSLNVFILRSRQ